ncbi:MAG: AMP-binding protein [Gemmatimonadetes bacterium]|nr:AMP-binding protein [Gemmatimonadota bacterium]
MMAGLTLLRTSAALVRALDGKRAALLLPTSSAFLTGLAASDGRAAVLINPLAAPREVAVQLDDANVGAVFTTRHLAEKLPPGVTHVLLDDAPERAVIVHAGTERTVPLAGHDSVRLEGEDDAAGSTDPCAIVYTSAMQGMPLGAVLTHRNLLANARATVEAMGLVRDDHMLALLPWSHLFGLTVTATAPLLVGARVTTLGRFNAPRAVELLEQGAVTRVIGVPAIFDGILQVLARRGTRLAAPALRVAICGGSTLPVAWQDQWADATGIELRQGYGLTEAGPVCLFNHVGRPNERGTLGRAFPGVAVSVREPLSHLDDPASAPLTAPVADGAEGELCVRGDNVSPGYLHGETTGLQQRDGWLYTGDRCVRDASGTVRFLGLHKPMFLRLGYNIYPREIEHAIGELPGVSSVRVRAVTDEVREHDIALDVTGTVSESEVKAWAADRLSAYKQPATITVRA